MHYAFYVPVCCVNKEIMSQGNSSSTIHIKQDFNMKRIIILAISMTCIHAIQAQLILSDSTELELSNFLVQQKETYQLPSLVFALVSGDSMIYSKALGFMDMGKQVPATIDSKYPIMSISKTFTATHLMQSVEKGSLSLMDNIATYIPEYQVKRENGTKASTNFLQLSTHRSGLGRNTGVDYAYFYSSDRWYLSNGQEELTWFATNEELLTSLHDLILEYPAYDFTPFGRHYSNIGFALLAIALERINKTSITQSIEQDLLEPLGMMHSGFICDKGVLPQLAKGYVPSSQNEEWLTVPPIDVDKNNTVMGAGGLYSTARDMGKYIAFQLGAIPHQNILSRESVRMMHTLEIGWSNDYYYPFSLVRHEGAMLGYRSNMAFNPDMQVGWVVFMNKHSQQQAERALNFYEFNSTIAQLIHTSIKPDEKEQSDLATYIGTYTIMGGHDMIDIRIDNKGLYSSYLNDVIDDPYLIPTGKHSFKVEGDGSHETHYQFILDNKHQIRALKLGPFIWNRMID